MERKKEKHIIKIIPEKEAPAPFWRKELNREKEGVIPIQIWKDMHELSKGFFEENKEKGLIGKYDYFMSNLPPKPKTTRKGESKRNYLRILEEKLKKQEKGLSKFKKRKELLVYLCVYLRESKYNKTDIDNYAKSILDCLKRFIGDDSKIITLIMEKKKLKPHDKKDSDFFEQTILIITDIKAKYLFFNPTLN